MLHPKLSWRGTGLITSLCEKLHSFGSNVQDHLLMFLPPAVLPQGSYQTLQLHEAPVQTSPLGAPNINHSWLVCLQHSTPADTSTAIYHCLHKLLWIYRCYKTDAFCSSTDYRLDWQESRSPQATWRKELHNTTAYLSQQLINIHHPKATNWKKNERDKNHQLWSNKLRSLKAKATFQQSIWQM